MVRIIRQIRGGREERGKEGGGEEGAGEGVVVVWYLASHLTSLSLIFLVLKWELTMVPTI